MPHISRVHLPTGELWFTTKKKCAIPHSWIPTLVRRHEAKLIGQVPGEPVIIDIDQEPPPEVEDGTAAHDEKKA